ncbi:TraR/DksA family transcriptional regulator [Klebsiella quasipneumoniae]|uniref:TraR/DksA family transcriptional regulator n=1 Tax=Klebsiella quasipneumoniae TaxID=1463165 RepID=UPI0035AD8BCD
MSAEIIDQANELAERRLEMTIQNMRINHHAVSATHCRDCGEEIPERRRELVAGCQRCADCQEEFEERGKHLALTRGGR